MGGVSYAEWLETKLDARDPVLVTVLKALEHEEPSGNPREAIARRTWARYAPELEREFARRSPARVYTGFGADDMPEEAAARLGKAAARLATLGYRLRTGYTGTEIALSGAAPPSQRDIYLPTAGFNGCPETMAFLAKPTPGALSVGSVLHPGWDMCTEQQQAALACTVNQVLGPDLRSPADFLLCWTADGQETVQTPRSYGVRAAIALAGRWGIPVFNLGNDDALDRLGELLKRHGNNKKI